MNKIVVVNHILRNSKPGSFVNPNGGLGYAPSNIALCKYWGKRDIELNLPVTSSLSLSLRDKGCSTKIRQEGRRDRYLLNGKIISSKEKFATRLKKFLDLFRPAGAHYHVDINMNIPVAAGLASSACGFAALILALDNLYNWRLAKTDLSILARLGSGSACRSLWDGFVLWQAGADPSGMDSHGIPLPYSWPEIRVGALIISQKEKKIASRDAMQQTVATSPLYKNWPAKVANDLAHIQTALINKDFALLGRTAEQNAIYMHQMMAKADPPINYSLAATISQKQKVWELRQNFVPVFFTQDAGPNLQLLFLAEHERIIFQAFPKIELIQPFADLPAQQLILVDNSDTETGIGEKLEVHLQGKLHRAFSVFIFRKVNNNIQILLQKRSKQKYHSANLWSNTCCGHPTPGENILAAAKRRLKEEMGCDTHLEEIGCFHYNEPIANSNLIENEIDYVLIGLINADHFSVNPQEVQDYRWINLADLADELRNQPHTFTVWFEKALIVALCWLEQLRDKTMH